MDWDVIRFSFFNLDSLMEVYPLLLKGWWMTIKLCVAVVPLGFALGALIATVHSFKIRWVNWLLIALVDFFRSIPPLVLLIYTVYGLPLLGWDVPAFGAVLVAFTINSAAYYGEIVRAGIESIPAGQLEAARSTGLGRLQAMVHVVLPQAVRNVAPDLTSNTLELIKATSIASVVALPELLRMGRVAQGLVYNATPLLAVAVIYLLMLWPLVRLLSRLERRVLAAR
jgi:polar amino acid transport system permease protein